jgi:VWFA-related protein
MPRWLVAVLTAVTAGVTLLGAQQPTFHAGTNTVSIYATVVDRSGGLVPDLTQEDFEVLDNGKRQTLTVFKRETQPITIVIMLDRSGSMVGNFAVERAAAERFVSALLPDDKARLGSFSNRVRIDPAEFTSDKRELVRILREKLQGSGATPLWNATYAAMDALAGEDGRRVVLVFTDGYDSPLGGSENFTLDDVIRRSQVEEIMVYAVGMADRCGGFTPAVSPSSAPTPRFQRGRPRGPRVPGGFPGGIGRRPPLPIPGTPPIRRPPVPLPVPGGPGGVDGGGRRPGTGWNSSSGCRTTEPDPGLRLLADEGGGGYFELRGADDLGETFSRIADELHQQYLLAFTAEELDGTLHRLDVRLRHPDLAVRARKSYLAKPQ